MAPDERRGAQLKQRARDCRYRDAQRGRGERLKRDFAQGRGEGEEESRQNRGEIMPEPGGALPAPLSRTSRIAPRTMAQVPRATGAVIVSPSRRAASSALQMGWICIMICERAIPMSAAEMKFRFRARKWEQSPAMANQKIPAAGHASRPAPAA